MVYKRYKRLGLICLAVSISCIVAGFVFNSLAYDPVYEPVETIGIVSYNFAAVAGFLFLIALVIGIVGVACWWRGMTLRDR